MDQDQPFNCDQVTIKTPQPSRGRFAKEEIVGKVLHINSALSSSSSSSSSYTRSGGHEFGSEKRETPFSRSFVSEMTLSLQPHRRENPTRPSSSPSAPSGIWTDDVRRSSTGCENFVENNETLQNGSWSTCYDPIRSDCTKSIEGVSLRVYPYSSVNSTPYCPSGKKGLFESSSIGQKRCASTDMNPSLPHKKVSLNLYGPMGIPVKRLSNFSEKPLPSSRNYQSGLKDVSTNRLHSFLSESACPVSRDSSFEQIDTSKDEGLLAVSEMMPPNRNTPFERKDLSTNKESSTRSETPCPQGKNTTSRFGDVIGTGTSSGPQNLISNRVSTTLTEKPLLGSQSTPSRSKGSFTSRFFQLDSVKMITSLKTPSSVTVRRNGQVTKCIEGMRTYASMSSMGHQTLDVQTEEDDINITHVRSVPSINNTADPDKLDISNDVQVIISLHIEYHAKTIIQSI
ncbi:hypothetical protein ACJMK2_042402 [Sinanodonta woodiana]|uniref:Uncharacterized protein n=1 Tax=Sinanodonta woodiana TaxID=1069815 RepID=A0ABD3W783_SINWO